VVLCRDMAAMVRAAKESFEKARRRALPPLVARNKSIGCSSLFADGKQSKFDHLARAA
jgi:hypothetical protein